LKKTAAPQGAAAGSCKQLILRALFHGHLLAVMLLLIDPVARVILPRKGFAAFLKKTGGFMKNP
jgi:hypothetical protein